VLGSPISHSLSPALHMAAYAALGLTWWRYEAIQCDEAGLAAFLDSCGPDWAGLSLTMPLKQSVLRLLDRPDPLVTEVGGANTVVFAAAQRLGYNTDVPGMVRALAARGYGGEHEPCPEPAVILGGGATACAALAALRDMDVRSAAVAVRDMARARQARRVAERVGIAVEFRPFSSQSLAEAALVISTVPAEAASGIIQGLTVFVPAVVFDVAYHPWPTPLAEAAAAAGAVVIGGFELLLYQAALQVELMTDRPAPVEQMRAAGLAELQRRMQRDSRHALRLRENMTARRRRAAKRRTTAATSHLASEEAHVVLTRWRVVAPAGCPAGGLAGTQAGELWPGASRAAAYGASRGASSATADAAVTSWWPRTRRAGPFPSR
jgi:shikimate dehydrogenase